jgi:hypothetical protein
MEPIRTVYIVEPDGQEWIIDRLMRDVAGELGRRGISTRIGKGKGYAGEDVVFNSRFLTALSDERARVNSLFITHVDDSSKERELRTSFARFNSFVCLSPHDADFVTALKADGRGVVGIELPARELRVRPIRLALFSARYADGRKNERWIADYFRDKTPEQRSAFVCCFLGWGWESFCAQLAAMEMNYEIYRYSRYMLGEYELYKEALATVDAVVYPGFDGGAMSVYDALAAGVDMLASNISYHRGLGAGVTLFDDRAGFYRELDRLLARHAGRAETLRLRSIETYTDRLLSHWNSLLVDHPVQPDPRPDAALCAREQEAVDSFRANYKRMDATRIRSALIRWLQSRFIRS